MATIRKRGDRWQVQVKIGGVRKSKTFSAKAAATTWARNLEKDLEDSSASGKAVITGTIGEAIKEVGLQPKAAGWSEGKQYYVNQCAAFDRLPLSSVTAAQIAHAAAGTGFSASGQDMLLKTLSGLMRDVTGGRGDVARAAARMALAERQKTGEAHEIAERDRRVSEAEISDLMSCWPDSVVPAAVLHFLVDTPIRAGEMCGLRWADLDGRIIIVRDRKHPKRKRDDRIPLLGRSYDVVMAQPRNGPLIFPFARQLVTDSFGKARDAVGLEDIRLHDLRHEGISRLFDADWTIPKVSLVSGHRDWRSLKRYTHVSAEELLTL